MLAHIFHQFPEAFSESGSGGTTPLLALVDPAAEALGGVGVSVLDRQVGVVGGLPLPDHGGRRRRTDLNR